MQAWASFILLKQDRGLSASYTVILHDGEFNEGVFVPEGSYVDTPHAVGTLHMFAAASGCAGDVDGEKYVNVTCCAPTVCFADSRGALRQDQPVSRVMMSHVPLVLRPRQFGDQTIGWPRLVRTHVPGPDVLPVLGWSVATLQCV